MEEQQAEIPMVYIARFWFSGLENAIEFGLVPDDFQRFREYLADTRPQEFFEFDTPGHTVVLANMVEVDAIKLISRPALDEDDSPLEEEPSEAVVQLVGREEPFSASTSEEHLGPKHPVRKLLKVKNNKFVHWLDARGQTVVMNPKKLSYVEHPKYWLEEKEEWIVDESDDPVEADVAE